MARPVALPVWRGWPKRWQLPRYGTTPFHSPPLAKNPRRPRPRALPRPPGKRRRQRTSRRQGSAVSPPLGEPYRSLARPALALLKCQDLVRFHAAIEFLQPGRPADLDIGCRGGPKAEVQPQVALRIETGLAQDLLPLAASSGRHVGSRADGAPVGFRADQLQLEPSIDVAGLVAQ